MSLFEAFGNELDSTTNDGTTVLQQFSSQIISAVKHALNSESSLDHSVSGAVFHRLFSAGCDSLLVMIETGFVSDPVALKRLLQPVILSEEDIPIVEFPTGEGGSLDSLVMKAHCVTEDPRSFPLFRLAKICFAANVSILTALGDTSQSTAALLASELGNGEKGRAIHSAAAAIDGYLLMTGRERRCGLTFKNISDLDNTVMDALVHHWPQLCASATASLIKAIKSSVDENEKSSLQAWLEQLKPIVFSGLHCSLDECGDWNAKSAALCIYTLRMMVKDHALFRSKSLSPHELQDAVNLVTRCISFTALGLSGPSEQSFSSKDGQLLVSQTCELLQDICQSYADLGADVFMLYESVVSPLVALQEGRLSLDSNKQRVISSCIRCSARLLQSCSMASRPQLEKALTQFTLSTLTDGSNHYAQRDDIISECLSLLQASFKNTTISNEEWGQVANFSASNDLWSAWILICSELPSGYGIKSSLLAVKRALGEKNNSNHARAISALRTTLQSASNDSVLVAAVLQCMGSEIFQLFRAYSLGTTCGTGDEADRAVICAESVKVILIAFQYLNSAPTEESKFVSFLSALFEVMAESVSFNGMPNHPSGKVGADETIGRMCAQVFVHIARTNPLAFKSTMAIVPPDRRVTLEVAVRADMSGYAAQRNDPAKKKLNLKGFVR
jgi:hypothetical protein